MDPPSMLQQQQPQDNLQQQHQQQHQQQQQQQQQQLSFHMISSGSHEDDDDKEEEDDENRIVETDSTGRFARYRECLGKGAYKEVFKGFDEEEGKEVAWNQLKVDHLTKRDAQRVLSEIKILQSMKNDNIINLFHYWVAKGADGRERVYFITELMTSGTLKAYLKRTKVIKPKVLKNWCRQILSGLQYLHSRNPPIIHRDLKCENIFINGHQTQAKIGDLGLAVIKSKDHASSVLGTPEFMAPELYDENYDEKVDIYAFGMVVIEIVTKEYPYSECTNQGQIFKKVTAGIKPLALQKVTDEQTRNFIELCIRFNAKERPSAAELLQHPFLAQPSGSTTTLASGDSVGEISVNSLTMRPSQSSLIETPTTTPTFDDIATTSQRPSVSGPSVSAYGSSAPEMSQLPVTIPNSTPITSDIIDSEKSKVYQSGKGLATDNEARGVFSTSFGLSHSLPSGQQQPSSTYSSTPTSQPIPTFGFNPSGQHSSITMTPFGSAGNNQIGGQPMTSYTPGQTQYTPGQTVQQQPLIPFATSQPTQQPQSFPSIGQQQAPVSFITPSQSGQQQPVGTFITNTTNVPIGQLPASLVLKGPPTTAAAVNVSPSVAVDFLERISETTVMLRMRYGATGQKNQELKFPFNLPEDTATDVVSEMVRENLIDPRDEQLARRKLEERVKNILLGKTDPPVAEDTTNV